MFKINQQKFFNTFPFSKLLNHQKDILLSQLTQKKSWEKFLNNNYPYLIQLSLKQIFQLFWQTIQVLRKKPIEYIIGNAQFLNHQFFVKPGVLIPRPETEELTLKVIKDLKNIHKTIPIKLLDFGTGSGVIAISIKKFAIDNAYNSFNISAVDSSKICIKIAKRNAQKILNNLENINFILDNGFTNLEIIKTKFDIIVANPPYISKNDKDLMSYNTLRFEPHQALFAPDNGLFFYKELAKLLPIILKENGKIYLEFGFNQAKSILDLFSFMKKKTIIKDFLGKERFFIGQF